MLRQDLTSSAIGPPATHGGSDVHHCLNVSKPLKPTAWKQAAAEGPSIHHLTLKV